MFSAKLVGEISYNLLYNNLYVLFKKKIIWADGETSLNLLNNDL